MLREIKVTYLCAGPQAWNLDLLAEKELAKHSIGTLKGRTILWPAQINAKCINPHTLNELRKTLKTDNWIIVDRLMGVEDWVAIRDHVCRTGYNFLCGKTPYGSYPQFPDFSKIYHVVKGVELVTVHTLGPERFSQPPDDTGVIWSEAVSLVAPVGNYIGIKVFAVGGPSTGELLSFL